MITRNLIRWSGLAAMAAPILIAVADVMKYFVGLLWQSGGDDASNVWMATSGWSIASALMTVAALLMLGGLLGLYSRQADKAGILGLIAFLMAFAGTALLIGFVWYLGFLVFPWLAEAAPELANADPSMRLALGGLVLMALLYLPGWVLFGVASLRAKVFPGLAAVLLVIGVVLDPITVAVRIPVLAAAVLGVGMGWMGYIVWTEKGEILV
jgi:hypothetical protein